MNKFKILELRADIMNRNNLGVPYSSPREKEIIL